MMQVRCIETWPGYNLIVGQVYDVSYEKGGKYYLVDQPGSGYFMWRFEIIPTSLPSGHIVCKCGTITSNSDMCCECMQMNTT